MNTVTAARSDSVDGFLENEYMPGMDMWVNQTASPGLLAPGLAASQSWELQRYLLLPAGAENIEWEYINPNVKIVYSLYSLEVQKPTLGFAVANSETGLTSYAGQNVDGVTRIDANEVAGDGSGSIVPMTWEYFNTTSNVADANQNYTRPEYTVNSGIHYRGGDAKTVNDYGTEIADSEGKSLYSVLNSTMVGFAYSNQGELANVVWTFDQPTSNAPGQGAGFLKRAWVGLKTKIADKAASGSVKKVLGINIGADSINRFRSIKTAAANLVGIPKGAKFFHSLGIPSGHFSGSQVGTSSISEGAKKRTGGIITLLVIILAIIVFIRYKKGKRGSKLLFN